MTIRFYTDRSSSGYSATARFPTPFIPDRDPILGSPGPSKVTTARFHSTPEAALAALKSSLLFQSELRYFNRINGTNITI